MINLYEEGIPCDRVRAQRVFPVQDSGVVEAANTARHDHMNLTVYF